MTSSTRPLGDICEFIYGNNLPEGKREVGIIPVYGSNGVVGFHNEAITEGETIIIGRKGSIGEINWSNVPCWPIDTTYYIQKKDIQCDLKWLFYTLKALDLTKLNKAAAVPGLNRDDAYIQLLPYYPNPNEQRRIARILDQADRLRRLRRHATQQTESFLQSVFIEMFGDPFKNPMKWTLYKLGDLGTLDRGRSKHRPRNAPELYGGSYPFIQTGDIANSDGYIKDYRQTYSDKGLAQSKLWPSGTLCITIAANIAKTSILTFSACFPDSIVGFSPNEKATTEYIQYWLVLMQEHIERTAPESAQKNINLEILNKLDVPCPPKDLQKKFSKIISQHEKLQLKNHEAERQAELLFQSLLHRAFSGQLSEALYKQLCAV